MASIEIDGKQYDVESGKMIIEVTDSLGIHIPRFCYHKKLSVAANCRMCLVEVEKSRKPLPACATPITDGMKIYTHSALAQSAQKAVMEFLLINHPLDCPICDQGGECELQDVSMGYGKDVSRYSEEKRAVNDDDLGALIATEMTRCIHCTRCVRFGEEVAGVRELGATSRGEHMQIGTYVQHAMRSEVSGNIIDLCPVGALTSKPYRYHARAWELTQHESIAPHDCLGSNVYAHTRRDQVMRVVPRENESINEVWLSDRDRFSYQGLYHPSRLQMPMIKRDGQWHEVSWQQALTFATQKLSAVCSNHGAEQVAAFAHPSSTTEEFYLLQKLIRSLGSNNVDHRLHQIDFEDQAYQPLAPISSVGLDDIEKQECILLLGSNITREQPLASLRVRKASLTGAKVMSLDAMAHPFNFDVDLESIHAPQYMPQAIASLAKVLLSDVSDVDTDAMAILSDVIADESVVAIAQQLKQANNALIIIGALCQNHPHASQIRSLINLIHQHTSIQLLVMTEGANSAGAALAGMLPHRGPFGQPIEHAGYNIQSALKAKLKAYFLVGIEPEYDIANPHWARQALMSAECVIMSTAYVSQNMKDYADVLLPMALSYETSGTVVNVTGQWQSFKGAVKAVGEARPAWKILRVLGNLLKCEGFDYNVSTDVLNEVKAMEMNQPANLGNKRLPLESLSFGNEQIHRIGSWPLYRSDALVRHAQALQSCSGNDHAELRIHPETAKRLKLATNATVTQGDIEITLPLHLDASIAEGAVFVANALNETIDLGHAFAPITIK